ncbi:MAG: ABC transporter substrate-binding protein [Proteobacteria bacterium]|nr:ABC transporter substrate-binding protein [Pseudomonadota bacterium]
MASSAAENYIEGIGSEILRLANAGSRGVPLRNKFAGLLGKYVDLRVITLASLGPYRNKLPAAEKSKLQDLVTLYASALFAWYVDDFKGQKFSIDRSAMQGKFIVVYSKIEKGGVRADEPIVWYLQQSGSRFNIVDMSVLGVRLSIAMRDRFQKELKKSKGDFEQLYAVLREAETW